MADLAKVALISVGGYFVLKYVFGVDLLASFETASTIVTPSTSSTTPGTTTTSPQAVNPVNPQSTDTAMLVQKAMSAAGQDWTNNLYTFDTFNNYYQQVRGIAGPDPGPLLPANARSELLTFGEWWGMMTKAGFSGMGLIAHHVNPYHNPQGTQFGDNLIATGMENYRKVF